MFASMAKGEARLQRTKNNIHAELDRHSCPPSEIAYFFVGKYFFSDEAITK